jgi:RNA polymerase sigma factor (sigma-70 family)
MTEQEFEELRPSAFAIAYRMLGSVSEAEDVVQEGFLRLHRVREGGERIESPRAYLATVVSRLSLDHLRSARVRRETYVGEWLPEPLVASAGDDPARKAEMADSLSLAFLVLLESLSPGQRAAFLLHDVFDEPYGRIAEIIATSEQNARQLVTRARRHVEERRPRFEASREQQERSRPASSRPPRRAISKRSRSCWPTTWCSAATAAARCPPSHVQSTAAPGWRGRSSRACAPTPAPVVSPCAARRSTASRVRCSSTAKTGSPA